VRVLGQGLQRHVAGLRRGEDRDTVLGDCFRLDRRQQPRPPRKGGPSPLLLGPVHTPAATGTSSE
jgi:hypothetical protein